MVNIQEVPPYLRRHIERMCIMIARVDSLLDLHSFLSPIAAADSSEQPPDPDDVLRAAVVLLHAHMEDSLRSVAREHLSRSSTDILKTIPLAGSYRAEKFTLADLIAHRGKSVDELLDESIRHALSKRSFNNCADVNKILEELGIDVAHCRSRFAELDEMISRRHRIVHECDYIPDSGHPPALTSITPAAVEKWKDAVQDFLQKLFYALQFVVEKSEPPSAD
jgi:hypothetical protein